MRELLLCGGPVSCHQVPSLHTGWKELVDRSVQPERNQIVSWKQHASSQARCPFSVNSVARYEIPNLAAAAEQARGR